MNRRRVLRVLAGAVLAAAVPVAFGGGTASADPPDKYGWWWKPKQNAQLTMVPAPPNVDTSDFYVANDVTGPLAVGAVHFQALGSGDATLLLKAKDQSTFTAADIGACPATSVWDGAFAGSWDQKPAWDAAKCVKGTAAADGLSMTWKVGDAFKPADGIDGEYSVILVPQGNVPFSVVLTQPGDDALTGYTPGQSMGFTGDVGDTGTVGAPASDFGAVTPADSGSFSTGAVDPGSGSLDLPAPGAGTTGSPAAGGSGAASGGAVTPDNQVALGTSPASVTGDSGSDRLAAVVLLVAIAGALWWLGGVKSPGQLALAGAAAASPGAPRTVVGGIGRFARPRSTPPNRL